jgi:hypothetical protein
MQIEEKSPWQEAAARVCRTATSACDSKDSESPIVKKSTPGHIDPCETVRLSTALIVVVDRETCLKRNCHCVGDLASARSR